MPQTSRVLPVTFAAAVVAGACNFLSSGAGQTTSNLANVAGGIACPALSSGGDALGVRYTARAELNAKVGAFVQAAKDLQRLAVKWDAEVTSACRKIGADIGVAAAAMQPNQNATASQAACGAVTAKVQGLLKGGVKIEAAYTPPKCEVDASARARCDGRCKVEVEPAQIVAQCTPAKLSGRCQGTCKGQCDGRCSGQCQGDCAVKDAQGRCAGKCDGTCQGQCDATCHASCEGTWQAPKCEGKVTPPKVDADCKASCEASVKFSAQCSRPQLEVKTSSDAQALARLVTSLSANLPVLIAAQVKLGREIAGEVQTLVRLGGELRGKLQGAGEQAIACVTAAASAVATASVSINVSFKASASVSGAVGASGRAG
ncbi:hypothetical protein [Nannocystis pusilla]|uniref:Uncharacterized protein n=1 Tax=Nannocystis pusilla TaxID=889268 RepID=A0ABS7TS60_9BACT|nr:hypothetical protein [Nannocystis pusilla]MBZ5711074.1 hypothetical protein [Nannocystis pusilla]